MDFKPVDINEMEPSDTIKVFCPHCEEHTFNVLIETLQLMKCVKIHCPSCGRDVYIFVNSENILCVE